MKFQHQCMLQWLESLFPRGQVGLSWWRWSMLCSPFQVAQGISGVFLFTAPPVYSPVCFSYTNTVAADRTCEKGPRLNPSSASWQQSTTWCVSSQRQNSLCKTLSTRCPGFPLVCNFWGGDGHWKQENRFWIFSFSALWLSLAHEQMGHFPKGQTWYSSCCWGCSHNSWG